MLEIRNLCAGYDGSEILHRIDLDIPEGVLTAIVGPNGCGKTTLLKAVTGILKPASGSIALDGGELLSLPAAKRARVVSYLSQSRPVSDLTVERMVLHGRFPYLSYPRRYGKKDMEIARRAMETMGIENLAQRNMGTLSGGQRQSVYLATVLAQDTALVLMDEPNTFLDIANQMQLMDRARFLADQGKTVVLVLHDLCAALRCADHVVVMKDGRVLRQGSAEQIFRSGCLEEAFGVGVSRVMTDEGWQYFCRERS